VIGHPLGHSMSPFIHDRLFALSGRTASYGAQDIPPETLSDELPRLLEHAAGVNVTIPHKQAVIPLLDGLYGRAELYRSVNTIAVTPEGRFGYNTDADGFLHALGGSGIPLAGRVALLGCGGVGRTFACEAALAGCEIVNAVRDADLAAGEALLEYVRALKPGAACTLTTLNRLEGPFDLLINATPVGMYPHADASPVTAGLLHDVKAVFDAVYNPNSSANELLDRKMAEYAQAVCHGRPHFHVALVQDISPNCDCHGENDAPILPDIGMFASFDPVALDQACADACLKATPIENSQLGEHLAKPDWHCHHDHFKDSNPNIEWQATLDQAEKIGLGTRQYELKIVK